jgi:hypothetical protein
MSLYRQAGGSRARTAAAAAVGGALAGGLAGFMIGDAGGDGERPSIRAALAAVRSDLRPARSGLELVSIEYREGVRDGRVVARTEYEAARAAVRRAREAVSAQRDELAALDPRAAGDLQRALSQLDARVSARAPPAAVDEIARRARSMLEAIVP